MDSEHLLFNVHCFFCHVKMAWNGFPKEINRNGFHEDGQGGRHLLLSQMYVTLKPCHLGIALSVCCQLHFYTTRRRLPPLAASPSRCSRTPSPMQSSLVFALSVSILSNLYLCAVFDPFEDIATGKETQFPLRCFSAASLSSLPTRCRLQQQRPPCVLGVHRGAHNKT